MKLLRIMYNPATSMLWAKPTSAVATAILHVEPPTHHELCFGQM